MRISETDTLLLNLPFIALLAAYVLRIDERLFTSRERNLQPKRPRFSNFDFKADVMADPDGRVAASPNSPKLSANSPS